MMLQRMISGAVSEFVSDADDGEEALGRVCTVIGTALLTLMGHSVTPGEDGEPGHGDPDNWLDPEELWERIGSMVLPVLDRERLAQAWREVKEVHDQGGSIEEALRGVTNAIRGNEPDALEALFDAPAYGEETAETDDPTPTDEEEVN